MGVGDEGDFFPNWSQTFPVSQSPLQQPNAALAACLMRRRNIYCSIAPLLKPSRSTKSPRMSCQSGAGRVAVNTITAPPNEFQQKIALVKSCLEGKENKASSALIKQLMKADLSFVGLNDQRLKASRTPTSRNTRL